MVSLVVACGIYFPGQESNPGCLHWEGEVLATGPWRKAFSCFLRWDCIAVNFALRTAFAASHRFLIIVFSLSFVSVYFLISSLISSVFSWLFSSILFSFHMFVFFTNYFFLLSLISNLIVLWLEKMLYNFSFLKFTETWFVNQDVIYPGECSVCTWEESILCFWMECPININ